MCIKAIAVFCGSKTGNDALYEEHARVLGRMLAERNISLVYGGGNKGLMAAVANGALERQGNVTGIIPELLKDREHVHGTLSELHVTDNMHSRKKMLYDKCDAAVILPGGYGTLDEVFEMLTWNQLSIHSKKIFILNSGGFYDHLVAHIQRMHEQNFLYDHPEEQMIIISEPGQLEKYL